LKLSYRLDPRATLFPGVNLDPLPHPLGRSFVDSNPFSARLP